MELDKGEVELERVGWNWVKMRVGGNWIRVGRNCFNEL